MTLNVKATDATTSSTLAPGEGISSDHTFRLRYQQRKTHVPLKLLYQLSPLGVVSPSLDLGRDSLRGQDQVLADLAQ